MIKKRSFAAYLILTIITCGIYGIVFWYSYTEDINRVCAGDGEESPNYIIVMLLSFITCGIYGIYWCYKQANRLKNAGPRYGVTVSEGGSEFLVWYLVGMLLCFVGSLISYNILIKNMNLLADAYNGQYRPGGPNGTGRPAGGTYEDRSAGPAGGAYGADQAAGSAGGQRRICYCGSCGAKLERSMRFCPGCGAENLYFEGAAQSGQQTSASVPGQSQAEEAIKNLAKMENLPAAAAAVVAVMGGIATLWTLFTYNRYWLFSFGNVLDTLCRYFLPMLLMAGLAFLVLQKDESLKKYIPLLGAVHYFLTAFCYTGIPQAMALQVPFWKMSTEDAWMVFVIIVGCLASGVLMILRFMGIRSKEDMWLRVCMSVVCAFFFSYSGVSAAQAIMWGLSPVPSLSRCIFTAVHTLPWMLWGFVEWKRSRK